MTDDEILNKYSEEINADIAKYASELDLTELENEKFAKRYKLRFIEGFRKGREERNIEIARNLLKTGLPIQTIAEFTGLTKEEIEKLK